ncbi:MAG: hypothetical protein ACP5FU_02715, partial [Nitrososphaeria archaeon]
EGHVNFLRPKPAGFLSTFLPFFQGYASACKYNVLKPLKTSAMGYLSHPLQKSTFAPLTHVKLN